MKDPYELLDCSSYNDINFIKQQLYIKLKTTNTVHKNDLYDAYDIITDEYYIDLYNNNGFIYVNCKKKIDDLLKFTHNKCDINIVDMWHRSDSIITFIIHDIYNNKYATILINIETNTIDSGDILWNDLIY